MNQTSSNLKQYKFGSKSKSSLPVLKGKVGKIRVMDFVETIRHDFSFPGHILPGTAFLIMGFWWMINSFRIYYNTNDEAGVEENESCEPLLHCKSQNCSLNNFQTRLPSKYPATFNWASDADTAGITGCEGFAKLLYASFDLTCHILVVITGGSLVDEAQHMTVYIFFILNALADIAVFRDSRRSYKLPAGLDFVMGACTWSAFGFLFLSHKHHKSELQIYYHAILAWIAISAGAAHLIQWRFQKSRSVLPSLFRAWCVILAGSWLYQIAFTFHNPFTTKPAEISAHTMAEMHHGPEFQDHHSHETVMGIMFGATFLTWHVALLLIFTVLVGVGFVRSNWRKQLGKINCEYVRISTC